LTQLLDRFFDSHHELWTRPVVTHLREREKWKEFYIFSWPTHLGGFFSLLFLVISLTTALFLGLPFQVSTAGLIWSGLVECGSIISTIHFLQNQKAQKFGPSVRDMFSCLFNKYVTDGVFSSIISFNPPLGLSSAAVQFGNVVESRSLVPNIAMTLTQVQCVARNREAIIISTRTEYFHLEFLSKTLLCSSNTVFHHVSTMRRSYLNYFITPLFFILSRIRNPTPQSGTNRQRAAFRTDMQLTLVLFRYGQSCQAAIAPDAVWGACDPAVSVTLSALQPDVPAAGTKYLTCMYQAQTQTCSIRVACKSCKVLSDASAFVFVAAQPSSTAQAIQWNLTFTTGIQTFAQPFVAGGQISTLASDIIAPPGFAFRGSTPSVVSLSILPSNYVPSTAGLVAGTGYLAQYNDSALGSYVPPSQVRCPEEFQSQ
jgi:hypothetical protein